MTSSSSSYSKYQQPPYSEREGGDGTGGGRGAYESQKTANAVETLNANNHHHRHRKIKQQQKQQQHNKLPSSLSTSPPSNTTFSHPHQGRQSNHHHHHYHQNGAIENMQQSSRMYNNSGSNGGSSSKSPPLFSITSSSSNSHHPNHHHLLSPPPSSTGEVFSSNINKKLSSSSANLFSHYDSGDSGGGANDHHFFGGSTSIEEEEGEVENRRSGHRGSRHQQQQQQMMAVNQQQYLQNFDPSDPYVECYNGGNYAEEDNERSVDDEELDDGYPGDEDHFVVVNAMVIEEWKGEKNLMCATGGWRWILLISLLMLEILGLEYLNILLLGWVVCIALPAKKNAASQKFQKKWAYFFWVFFLVTVTAFKIFFVLLTFTTKTTHLSSADWHFFSFVSSCFLSSFFFFNSPKKLELSKSYFSSLMCQQNSIIA